MEATWKLHGTDMEALWEALREVWKEKKVWNIFDLSSENNVKVI